MKKLSKVFYEINPEMLDDWFEEKMELYKNSKTKEHLEIVYNMLTNNTVIDDSLSEFHERW